MNIYITASENDGLFPEFPALNIFEVLFSKPQLKMFRGFRPLNLPHQPPGSPKCQGTLMDFPPDLSTSESNLTLPYYVWPNI